MSGPVAPYPPQNITYVFVPQSAIPTPLIFLTLEDAHNINIALYLHIASTGVLLWDFLNNLRNDCKLLFSYKVGVPTLLYFVIRITLVAYTLGRAVLLTSEVDDCGRLSDAINILLIISVICTTTLFYLRVLAVYTRNTYIATFFGFTWLATVAMTITFFRTFGAVHIEPTRFCRETIRIKFLTATTGVLLVNDLLIYIAIAYRIYRIFLDYDFEGGLKRKFVILFFGASLPVGSKIVLLESQLYCLIIVISKAFLVGLVSMNEIVNSRYIICHLVLVTVLSSRVYRELRMIRSSSHRIPTEFRSQNLTSAEFADADVTNQDKKIRKLEESTSIAGSIARTASICGSAPSFMSNNRSEGPIDMDTFSHSDQRSSFQSDRKRDNAQRV